MRFRYVILLVVIACSIGRSFASETQLSTYYTYAGGYDIIVGNGYNVYVSEQFEKVSVDISDYVENEYDGVIDVRETFISAKRSEKMDIVPFKPALVALIVAGVKLDVEGIDFYDGSIDLGLFVAEQGMLKGGMVVIKGFTRPILDARFAKTIIVEFDELFMSKQLSSMDENSLNEFLIP